MKIIDAWAQHPSPKLLEQPFLDSLKRWLKQKNMVEVPVEHTVEVMRLGGVDKALICSWYGPEGALISNDQVREVIEKYPELFVGVAAVDIRNPVEAVRTLKHYVTNHHFKALRIIQWLWELPCTHPFYYPLYVACVELDIPVCLQVGLTGPLKSSEVGRPIHIERIALDFPQLKIVCGHVGYPWHNEMIAFATKFPNVYIDTSAYKPKRYPVELVHYIKTNGRKKVLFGTNYPMITPSDCMAEIELLGLDENVKEMFLGQNAQGIFKL